MEGENRQELETNGKRKQRFWHFICFPFPLKKIQDVRYGYATFAPDCSDGASKESTFPALFFNYSAPHTQKERQTSPEHLLRGSLIVFACIRIHVTHSKFRFRNNECCDNVFTSRSSAIVITAGSICLCHRDADVYSYASVHTQRSAMSMFTLIRTIQIWKNYRRSFSCQMVFSKRNRNLGPPV